MPSQAEIGFLIFLRCYTGAWSHDIFLHSRLSSWSGGERSSCKAFQIAAGMTDVVSACFCKICKAGKFVFISSCCGAHLVALNWLALGCCWWPTNVHESSGCTDVCVCACTLLTGHGWLHIFIQQCMGMERWGSIQRSSSYAPRISPATLGDVPATRSFFDIAPRLSSNLASRFPIS
jgi:hypothetical protein